MSREGRPEMGSFSVMSMVIINVQFTTIYVKLGLGGKMRTVLLSHLSMVAGASQE